MTRTRTTALTLRGSAVLASLVLACGILKQHPTVRRWGRTTALFWGSVAPIVFGGCGMLAVGAQPGGFSFVAFITLATCFPSLILYFGVGSTRRSITCK
jgi:hypothetical protein